MDAMDTEEEWTNHRDTVDPETRAYISSLVTAVSFRLTLCLTVVFDSPIGWRHQYRGAWEIRTRR
jgi:hypothetical protein